MKKKFKNALNKSNQAKAKMNQERNIMSMDYLRSFTNPKDFDNTSVTE